MKTLQVFDPALCCSTGVCGVEVDQALVTFAADVDWAQQLGAKIERFNLSQQPMAFAENTVVRGHLEKHGQTALPLILLDGEVALSGHYPTRQQLSVWLSIGEVSSIMTQQVAELIAIGAAIASNCEPCFKYHFAEARKLGVADADMLRAVNIAQKVKDAPARKIWELAQRMLESSPASNSQAASACCSTATAAAPKAASQALAAASSCCGSADVTVAKPASSKCC